MKDTTEHLYEAVYHGLIEEITNGRYGKGDMLPTENEIAESYEVSRITTKKALGMLVEEGVIRRVRGKGSFVINVPESKGARTLKQVNSSNLIGLVIPDFSDGYAGEMLKAIEEDAARLGLFVVLRRSQGLQSLEQEAIESLIDLGVKGLIIMPVHGENYNQLILRLVLDGFPVVFVDRYLKGISSSFVTTDNVHSAKLATNYLFEQGHNKICFVSPPSTNTSTLEDRMKGFFESYAQRGIAVDHESQILQITSTMPGRNTEEMIAQDIETIEAHLARNLEITALFASEYNIALLCHSAVQSMGKCIPQDISIICFDVPQNHIKDYLFTHICQKEREMGQIALDLVLKQASGDQQKEQLFLRSELVLGKSTRKRQSL